MIVFEAIRELVLIVLGHLAIRYTSLIIRQQRAAMLDLS